MGDVELREERWRLAALEEASGDAVITVAPDGTVLGWNRAAQQLYGYSADEMVGGSISVVVPCDRQEEVAAVLARLSRGEAVPYHETFRRSKSGSTVEVGVRMAAVREPGDKLTGAVIVDRDLTEQRWTAVTLDATMTQMMAALEGARSAEALSRQFLADAAHQLRSPVTGIQLAAETLLQGAEPPDRDRLLADLVRQTARAGRLVAKLLRVARLDKGEALVRRPCNVADLVGEECDRIWHLAPNLDVKVRAEGLPQHPLSLDGGALREILANLLENAMRHAESSIQVLINTKGEDVEVRVVDDGPGLPPGSEEKAFERFVSLDGKGGSGLGLPIARELAHAHGGGLTYERGAFVLRLPGGETGSS